MFGNWGNICIKELLAFPYMENTIVTIPNYFSVFRSVCKFIKPYLKIIAPVSAWQFSFYKISSTARYRILSSTIIHFSSYFLMAIKLYNWILILCNIFLGMSWSLNIIYIWCCIMFPSNGKLIYGNFFMYSN